MCAPNSGFELSSFAANVLGTHIDHWKLPVVVLLSHNVYCGFLGLRFEPSPFCELASAAAAVSPFKASRVNPAQDPATIAIGCRQVAKRFGHVQALRSATVMVAPGEVVALVGDNGAGKSTLLRALLGLLRPDSGEIIIRDEIVQNRNVRDAQARGVDAVHQDLALAPDLSVVDNMFLGHAELRPGLGARLGLLARGQMTDRTAAALEELSIRLPSLTAPSRELSGGQRQAVAVARAVMWSTTAVLLDEPTAALGARQSEIVCQLMRTVAERGLGVLVVSHDLPRILKWSDKVTVLWRGETAVVAPASQLTVPDLVATMVGYRAEQTS